MTRRIAGTLGLVLAMAALIRADGGGNMADYSIITDDRAELERGEWRVVAMTTRGKEIPKNLLEKRDVRMVFKDNKLTQSVSVAKRGNRESPYKLNSTSSPKEIEWALNANITYHGIYQLDNDTLKIAIGLGERPKNFTAESAIAIYTLKRVKP